MTGRFEIAETALAGVRVLQLRPMTDERGWFERVYCSTDLADLIGGRQIVQVNRSRTRSSATVRGLHYQVPPFAEAKIVTCLQGTIYDIALDLRRNSPTFMRWHGETLSAENHRSLFIPEGFAHGFQTTVDDCEVLYLTTAAHDVAAERGVNPLDLRAAIVWPLAVEHLSERDRTRPPLDPEFDGIDL